MALVAFNHLPAAWLAGLLLAAACSSPGGSAPAAAEEASNPAAEGASAASDLEAQLARAGIRAESQPARVTYKDHKTGVTIGVLNESHTDPGEYYSQPRAELVYKVIPDLDMGALLKQLEDFGFFAHAQPAAVRVPGARETILLERGPQSFTLAYTTQSEPKLVQLVQDCANAIQAMYNMHQAFQVMQNASGADYFDGEQRRLMESRKPR